MVAYFPPDGSDAIWGDEAYRLYRQDFDKHVEKLENLIEKSKNKFDKTEFCNLAIQGSFFDRLGLPIYFRVLNYHSDELINHCYQTNKKLNFEKAKVLVIILQKLVQFSNFGKITLLLEML